MATIVRLGGALDSFDVISTPGIVQDVPPEVSDLYATLEMVANTTKPLVILVSDEDAFPGRARPAGAPARRPVRAPLCPALPESHQPAGHQPRHRGQDVGRQRARPALSSIPTMAWPAPRRPSRPAGALALLNAELLAGLVLSQLIREGQPVILGSLPAFFDMKGMGSFYDAHSYLVDLACAEMMAHYGLPHVGTSGSGMGWGADLIASGHQWLNHLLSCLGKVGLAPFVGDNLGSKAFSPTVIVYADEIIAQARRLAEGFALDADAVALDEIAQVGPGGNFLTSPLTLKHFRRAYYRSRHLSHAHAGRVAGPRRAPRRRSAAAAHARPAGQRPGSRRSGRVAGPG